ncbi:hypothetical protein GLOIN_2v1777126 [Rhizophagus irregularis DAOM 181602=DAOM 197198]|uniref:Uncharacterized protein n=1 Tax=Rhizophagus irregularis (strain DAOM 181602 / DAOM 197198 / MUCL 43194) TaxID=747089 RepID=A0A2P4PVI8_RHIID|nr:hypothetical protein GLOIN_2v1777126 [Rhizophagus irregularis DAOM 181602=DAOM 197198]POG69419.1 hypothetical protein GLOIN_2v1777126 [Rhizophagus irregularis DAOM 181602=DAOM 197198]|eukprot:XP_025176285.1 hypothetical protein GLOIN_2v1777126 [Rhizophagus irregularis DAOM 181602=DAOM 197198]
MDSFLIFDGFERKFYIVDSFEQLTNLFPSLAGDPLVKKFLSDIHDINLEKSVTTFITNLNEVLKCLGKGAIQIKQSICDIYDESIQLFIKMFNKLLECKEFLKEAYHLSLSILALTFTFSSLNDAYTQFMRDDGDRIPLDDNQKQKFKDCLERLQIILEDICNNLSNICQNSRDNTIYVEFKNNLDILQNRLEDFTKSVDSIIIDLKPKIQKFQREKKYRWFKAGASTVITIASFAVGGPLLRVVGGASGGYAIYNGIKIYKLHNIINEHEQVRDVINDTQKFLEGTRDYIDIIDPDDLEDQSQPPIILDQFTHLRNEVKKMRSTLPSIFQ